MLLWWSWYRLTHISRCILSKQPNKTPPHLTRSKKALRGGAEFVACFLSRFLLSRGSLVLVRSKQAKRRETCIMRHGLFRFKSHNSYIFPGLHTKSTTSSIGGLSTHSHKSSAASSAVCLIRLGLDLSRRRITARDSVRVFFKSLSPPLTEPRSCCCLVVVVVSMSTKPVRQGSEKVSLNSFLG